MVLILVLTILVLTCIMLHLYNALLCRSPPSLTPIVRTFLFQTWWGLIKGPPKGALRPCSWGLFQEREREILHPCCKPSVGLLDGMFNINLTLIAGVTGPTHSVGHHHLGRQHWGCTPPKDTSKYIYKIFVYRYHISTSWLGLVGQLHVWPVLWWPTWSPPLAATNYS